MVRAWPACRGLRAWRVRKQTHGTEEARRVPAALTARAKQEGWRNDKKCRLALRESDRLIVSSGKAQAPEAGEGADVLAKHTQAKVEDRRSRQAAPQRAAECAPYHEPVNWKAKRGALVNWS
jgi:hypothetical protein